MFVGVNIFIDDLVASMQAEGGMRARGGSTRSVPVNDVVAVVTT